MFNKNYMFDIKHETNKQNTKIYMFDVKHKTIDQETKQQHK